jgi:hypothetical protein
MLATYPSHKTCTAHPIILLARFDQRALDILDDARGD